MRWSARIRCSLLLGAFTLLASSTGCLSSSGLLFQPGPHKLLKTAELFSKGGVSPSGAARELTKQVLAEYRVEPGDVLTVEQAEFDASVRLPSDQIVRADGTIDLGPYGRLLVVGRTVDEIQQLVQQRVDQHAPKAVQAETGESERTDGKSQLVVVRLIEPESKVYYVVGEVNSPGTQRLIGRETVLDAIFAAGGLSDKADRHKIILSRPSAPGQCRIVMPICYRHIVQLGDTSTNYQIAPGDRIYVPSLTFWDELGRNLCLTNDEVCPRCACCQTACPAGAYDIEYLGQALDASERSITSVATRPEESTER
jgi:polysaccharide export outer membrane protein